MAETPYMRTELAAEFMRLSPRTLEKWRRLGIGPKFVRLGARLVVYDRRDLEAWCSAQRAATTGAPAA